MNNKNKEKTKKYMHKYMKNYRKIHPEKFNTPRLLARQKEINSKIRPKLIKLLGNKCIKCGFTDIRALQIDHKNGGGRKEHKKFGNQQLYRYYLKHPIEAKNKLQILCANCNWIKRVEKKEVRGQIKN